MATAPEARNPARMDIDEIKTLTDLMVENDLSEIMIRDGDKRIVLRRGGRSPVVAAVQAAIPAAHPAPVAPAPAPAASAAPAAPAVDANLGAIKSPMVVSLLAEIDATCVIWLDVSMLRAISPMALTAASTACSMPRFSSMGLAPAAT